MLKYCVCILFSMWSTCIMFLFSVTPVNWYSTFNRIHFFHFDISYTVAFSKQLPSCYLWLTDQEILTYRIAIVRIKHSLLLVLATIVYGTIIQFSRDFWNRCYALCLLRLHPVGRSVFLAFLLHWNTWHVLSTMKFFILSEVVLNEKGDAWCSRISCNSPI